MSDYEFITTESLDDGQIIRIMLDRPEARNAQNRGMLVELNDAFLSAEADDDVRVVILGGNGKMFSSGHDMGSKVSMAEYNTGPGQHQTRTINGATRKGSEIFLVELASPGWQPALLVGRHDAKVGRLAFHPDGETLAAMNQQGEIRLWPTSGERKPSRSFQRLVGGEHDLRFDRR